MNLKQFLGICEHRWEVIRQNHIVDEYDEIVGDRYHLQCEKCGAIKFVRS